MAAISHSPGSGFPSASLLKPSPVPEDLVSLPMLMDGAAPFPFASSSPREAEHMWQVHRAHTWHGHRWLCRVCCLQSHLHVGLTSEISTSFWVCLDYLCQVCVSVWSCLWFPSFLIIPFLHLEGPWPYTLKGADASTRVCFHIPLEFIPWVGQTTCLFLAGIKGKSPEQ